MTDVNIQHTLDRLADDLGAMRGAMDKDRDVRMNESMLLHQRLYALETTVEQIKREHDADTLRRTGRIAIAMNFVFLAVGAFISKIADRLFTVHPPHHP